MIMRASEGVGALLMAISAFNNALDLAVLKLGNSELPALQLTLFRIFGQLCLIITPIMVFNRISILPFEHKQIWPYVFGRAGSGCLSMLFSVGATTLLPLGDGQVLMDLYPVATALVACKLLNEDFLRSTPFALVLSVLGTVLITQPTLMQVKQINLSTSVARAGAGADCQRFAGVCLKMIGQAMGIGVSLSMALNFVFARKAKEANTFQLVFWLNVFQALACLAAIFCLGQKFVVPSSEGWMFMIATTLFNCCYLILSTLGSQRCPAAVGAMLQSTDIVWAYFFQVLLFGQHPSLSTLLGVACVLLATSLLTFERWIRTWRHPVLE